MEYRVDSERTRMTGTVCLFLGFTEDLGLTSIDGCET